MLAHEGEQVDVAYKAYPLTEKQKNFGSRERLCLVVDMKNDLQAMTGPPVYADSVRCFS